jgi:hypothetical protein
MVPQGVLCLTAVLRSHQDGRSYFIPHIPPQRDPSEQRISAASASPHGGYWDSFLAAQ